MIVRGQNSGQQMVEIIENSASVLHVALKYKFYAENKPISSFQTGDFIRRFIYIPKNSQNLRSGLSSAMAVDIAIALLHKINNSTVRPDFQKFKT